MDILYVEDDVAERTLITAILRHLGHHVSAFDNTPDAQRYLIRHEPEVVLVDFKLEGSTDGLHVVETARRLYPACTIILISHYGNMPMLEDAIFRGIDLFVRKPVRPDELVKHIEVAYTKHHAYYPGLTHRYLQCEALVVDTTQRIARWEGVPLNLSPNEYRLLLRLMSHPGIIFSFEELCLAIFGEELSYAEARLRMKTFITRLRQALPFAGEPHAIESRRAQGYRWARPVEKHSGHP